MNRLALEPRSHPYEIRGVVQPELAVLTDILIDGASLAERFPLVVA